MMKFSGKYAVTADIEALERKYADEVAAIDQLHLATPGRGPGLSRRASLASPMRRSTNATPTAHSTFEFPVQEYPEE